MKTALILGSIIFSGGAHAGASDALQIYECRYQGFDAAGYRMEEVGHVITSEIDGAFETRTLGISRQDGPSGQVYAWDNRPDGGRKLYVALFDPEDTANYDGQVVDIGTEEVRVALTARGASVSLRCHIL